MKTCTVRATLPTFSSYPFFMAAPSPFPGSTERGGAEGPRGTVSALLVSAAFPEQFSASPHITVFRDCRSGCEGVVPFSLSSPPMKQLGWSQREADRSLKGVSRTSFSRTLLGCEEQRCPQGPPGGQGWPPFLSPSGRHQPGSSSRY